jgi:hypothetical protein
LTGKREYFNTEKDELLAFRGETEEILWIFVKYLEKKRKFSENKGID